MLKAQTPDEILNEELDDFIDVLLSCDHLYLQTTLLKMQIEVDPRAVAWIMDPPHFNIIQRLLINNFNLQYSNPMRTLGSKLTSHTGTALPPSSREIFDNWIQNILRELKAHNS